MKNNSMNYCLLEFKEFGIMAHTNFITENEKI